MSIKRIIKNAICVMLLLTVIMLNSACASASGQGFTTTTNDDGTLTITEYTGDAENLVIPESINGVNVTAIADKAFMASNIKTLEVPSGITSIGSQAFAYAVNLESVSVLAMNITYGSDVFQGDKALNKVAYKQDSTTEAYFKDSTITKEFIGPYRTAESVSIKVNETAAIPVENVVGEVTYKSTDESIAKAVDGKVLGVSDGTADITVSTGEGSITFKVTVTGLKMTPEFGKVTVGYAKLYKLSVPDGDEDKVVWTSSDESIATVSDGLVTGVSIGNVNIFAEYAGKKYTAVASVVENKVTLPSYNTNAKKYKRGTMGYSTVTKTDSGYKVTGHFINGTKNKVSYIKNITFKVMVNGKVVASKKIKKLKVNAKGKTTKAISITFAKSNTKSEVDLTAAGPSKVSVTSTGGKFYYTKTKTITKTVTKEVKKK